MYWILFQTIKLKYRKHFFLSHGAITVRLPISLNIAGKVYHLETHMISNDYIYLKVYDEDIEYLPALSSHLLIFMSLDLFNKGKFELEGKLVFIEKLNGGRLGLWISYKTETIGGKSIISEFVRNHYTPRYSVRFDVDIKTKTKFIQAEAINLSEKGIFIEADLSQLEEREMCTLNLYLENFYITVNAEVSWINKGKMYDKPNGYGLKFVHDMHSKSRILKYLELLKNRSEILR